MYEECLQKNIPLSTTTYNYILQVVPTLKDSNEERKLLLTTVLRNMAKNKVMPNIGTLNSALKSLATFTNQLIAKEFSLSLIADFKSINVQPSLASYYYLLLIFCRQSKYMATLLKSLSTCKWHFLLKTKI